MAFVKIPKEPIVPVWGLEMFEEPLKSRSLNKPCVTTALHGEKLGASERNAADDFL